MKEKIETKTYIMSLTNKEVRKVTVPATWKVTFGPTVPFTPSTTRPGYDNVSRGWSVRFYEGNKENLRAVFSDVLSFRDADIVVEEKVTKVQRKVVQEKDPQKGHRDVEVEARVSRWCDPLKDMDDPDDNPFLLEAGEK